jgi:DNA gyrase/topoisomerase IV subunit A
MTLTHNILAIAPFLLITLSCASTRDLQRLEHDTNLGQDQIRRELTVLRESISAMQRQIDDQREGRTPVFQRVHQEMAAISNDVGQNRQAVVLMVEAVAAIAQQLSVTGTEEKKAEEKKPKPSP